MSAPSSRVRRRGVLLIVDDDLALRSSLRRMLRGEWEVVEAGSCAEAFSALEARRVDVMLVDIKLPDGHGFEVVNHGAQLSPRPGVIVMTGDAHVDNAIAALQHGAADFLIKPFSINALEASVERVCVGRQLLQGGGAGAWEDEGPLSLDVATWRQRYAPRILGNHDLLLQALGVLQRVADTTVSVLVTGDSGTGKELVARALHTASARSGRPFVVVNAAAIPENLLESELFGHLRGAFTGASEDRIGTFRAAEGGTLFLDEIGELPLGVQAKILRVLQEKQVTPVGASAVHDVDVRIVAATNRDLDEMVAQGTFREDLLYRLNVIQVEMPPLRKRRSDIPTLVKHFIEVANQRRGRQVTGIASRAMDAMVGYDWPGNIRQLENVVERMVVLHAEGTLDVKDLPRKLRRHGSNPALGNLLQPLVLPAEGIDLSKAVSDYETFLILQALERTDWNKNQAANVLRINRTTLVEKLKRKGIVRNGQKAS